MMAALPAGWHWAFCLSTPARAALATDGLPASDPILPQTEGFGARVMGGTTFDIVRPVPMEADLGCTTRVAGRGG
jgi:hydroxyacyl-ACP dehydratase HTD2-like protein with hotdog domain